MFLRFVTVYNIPDDGRSRDRASINWWQQIANGRYQRVEDADETLLITNPDLN